MGAWRRVLLVLGLVAVSASQYNKNLLRQVYAWKFVDYEFPNNLARTEAVNTGEFTLNGTLPLGLERWRDKLFITVPRRKAGVPATLGYIRTNNTELSPRLIPYPDWRTNSFRRDDEADDTVHISSTYRVRADPCDRLWIVDTGLADTGTGSVRKVTAPQILVYDLKTDTLIRNYFLKDEDYNTASFLANIAIDVTSKTCDDAYAYMPDLGEFSLVVYSLKTNTSWRVNHHYFYFDPLKGNFTIADINFHWTDGAFGVTLSEIKSDGFRLLYFHSLASNEQFAVSTKFLRDKALSSTSFNEFQHLGSRGENSQATGSYYDEFTGVMFYMEIARHAVTCWNAREKPVAGNVATIVADPLSNEFIYPSDIRADYNGFLWMINNNLPVYIYKEVDNTQYNYFIFTAPIYGVIKGTVCEPEQFKSQSN